MNKSKKTLLIVGIVLAVLLALALVAILVFGGGRQEEKIPTGDMTYTVQVSNSADTPLEGVGVYVYEDETQTELVWFDKTNAEGKMSFTAPYSENYVAVLGNVPAGLVAEDHYPITGELTRIVLSAGVMSEEDMKTMTYKLGDVMMDFTITDTEGVEYTLSELLKTKKAVVLNFWYIECMPCKMEFPFMQEAYEEYKDQLEILAMNPVNADEAAIAAFKKELGLTFPMAKVDAMWEQVMQLTAYPTTVVIDRFGNITLIHKGSIDSAETFKQLFAYFTAEDYEPKAIENLEDIVTEPEGSEDNPFVPGSTEFDITLKPDEVFYFNLYKITENMFLTVKGENFVLTYKDKEYTPKNGSLTLTISAEGPSTAVELMIKNTGKEKQTYHFSLALPKGTMGNPYSLKLGEFDFNTGAGNEKGTFGRYTAEKSGTLTVRCLRSNVSKYGFHLYNLRSYAMRNADEDGKTDEDGYLYVSVNVKKGDNVEFSVAVARDSNNYIAAGSFRFELILVEGDGEDEKKETLPTQPYTITVTDEAGNPVSGVAVNIKGEFTYVPPVDPNAPTEPADPTEPTEPEDPTKNEVKVDKNIITDETGVASIELVPGPYMATVSVPAGYKLAKTEYELTETVTELAIQLQTLRYLDYSVQVLDPNGAPVPNVTVLISSDSSSVYGQTDASGTYTVNQPEGEYTVTLYDGIPAEYASPEANFTFPENVSNLSIKLIYKPGSVQNPIAVDGEFPIYTGLLDTYQAEFYNISGANGMTIRVLDENAIVYMFGQEYRAVDGMVSLQIPEDAAEPVLIAVMNGGAEKTSYRVNVGFPLGTQKNPVVLDKPYSYITTRALNGDDEVWYSLAGVAGQALIISDPDAQIVYNGRTYTAENGVVTVELAENADPALVAFRNGGSQMEKYSVRVGYPWGSENNPITVSNMTTITTRSLVAGDGVWYAMSGVAGMEITVADENALILYNDQTYTPVDGVVTVLLAEDGEPALVCFQNSGAASESYTAKLKYPLGSQQNPYILEGVFATFDTVQIPAGQTVYYKVKDVAGATASVSGDAQLTWNDTQAQSVTIPASSQRIVGLLGICNSGAAAQSYTVTVSFDAQGTRQNPEIYESGVVRKTLDAGDTDGYYYAMIADKDGTMTVSLSTVRGYVESTLDGIDVALSRDGTSNMPKMSASATETEGGKSVSIQVAQGDVVRIQLQAVADAEGNIPSKKIAFSAAVSIGEPAVDDVDEDAYVDPGESYNEAEDPRGSENNGEYIEPPEVIEEDGGDNQFLTYTVTVTDFTGVPMGNVIVQLYSGDKLLDGGMTNANGVFYTLQKPGDYGVKLSFSSSGCYYEEATAVLSPSVTSLIIPVTTVLPGEGGTHWDIVYQMVGLGGTYVSMQPNVVNYYGFYPEVQGTYRFQVSDPSATISYWGTGMPNDLTVNTMDFTGNAFTLSIGESMIGGTHFIGITGVEDGILVITRLGDAQFNVNELPWIPYVPAVPPTPVTGLPTGKTPTKVDLHNPTSAYPLVYNDADKFYHLGSSTGPVVYVQLAADKNGNVPPYVDINAMVGGVNENMATAFRWADYDDTGNYIKEDYTAVMIEMCGYAEANEYGVYPLTKDVVYMIQKCGTYLGWWESANTKGNLLFKLEDGALDPSINLEIGWMFACCYFE